MNKHNIKFSAIALAMVIAVSSCNKDEFSTPSTGPVNASGNYSSLQDFYTQNQPAMWQFNINAVTGGSFTSLQGTVVTIPPNAFVDQSGNPVTGNVVVNFQDIYKKSDMLFANKGTNTSYGLLNSGGEFFIKVEQNNMGVTLATGQSITVAQPTALTGGLDTGMTAFTLVPDSAQPSETVWVPNPNDVIYGNVTNYIYNVFGVNYGGTWSNCDNPYPFASAPQTNLTMHSTASLTPYGYNTNCYLIFMSQTAGIHIYQNGDNYDYPYSPLGYQCTAVNMAIKDGKLFAAFTPVTIGTNQTYNFTLTEMTTAAFKAQLDALN